MKTRFLVLTCAMLMTESVARADDRYAAQIVAMDAGIVLAGAASESPPIFLAGYWLGAPIIHWAHKNVLEGFASLAMRVVIPVVGAFAFRAATGDEHSMAVGAALAGVAVSTIDAAVLARTPQRPIVVVGGTF